MPPNRLQRPRHHALVRIVLAAACVVAPAWALQWLLHRFSLPAPAATYLWELGSAALGLLGYVAYVRRFEARPLVEFARAGAVRELALGAALGSALFTATVLSLALAGSFELQSHGRWSALAGPCAGALMAGVLEELVFRGIIFRIVEQSLGTWLALAVSALLFGAAHLATPNWNWLDLLAIVLEAGVLLAAAFVATRRLWLPIGVHVAWNLTEGGIFGVAVSGTPTRGLLRGALAGPDWLTGGAYGVEGSTVAIAWCMIAAAALFTLAARRGNIVAWNRHARSTPRP